MVVTAWAKATGFSLGRRADRDQAAHPGTVPVRGQVVRWPLFLFGHLTRLRAYVIEASSISRTIYGVHPASSSRTPSKSRPGAGGRHHVRCVCRTPNGI